MNDTPKRKPGRPKKYVEPRHNVTVTMTAPMRDKIRAAADRNGRTVSSEIDTRLAISLALEEAEFHRDTRLLLDFIRLCAPIVELETQKRWTEDVDTAGALIGAISTIIRAVSPLPDEGEAIEVVETEMLEVSDNIQKLREGGPFERQALQAQMKRFLKLLNDREDLRNLEVARLKKGRKLVESLVDMFSVSHADD